MYKWKLEQLAKQLEVGLAINDINPKKKKNPISEKREFYFSQVNKIWK